MAAAYRISVDIGELLAGNQAIADQAFAHVQHAVRATANEAARRWRESVYQARLWEREKTAYLGSIHWEMTGPMEALVWSDYGLAGEIEEGRPARDMKLCLPTARKARQSKAGVRYLIIPFRHGVPGTLKNPMPPEIHEEASQLAMSRVTGVGRRISASGKVVPQLRYRWAQEGGRLPAGLADKLKPHHVADPYAGMVRMDTSSGKQKRSAYLTFRTMSAKSSGWIVPAKPGLYLAKGVADALGPVFHDAVREGIRFDAGLG